MKELQNTADNSDDVSLIIDGKTLIHALDDSLRRDFIELCTRCTSVICCRVSPIQKAEMVELVQEYTGAISLAIGKSIFTRVAHFLAAKQEIRYQEISCRKMVFSQEISWFCQNWQKSVGSMRHHTRICLYLYRCSLYSIEFTSINEILGCKIQDVSTMNNNDFRLTIQMRTVTHSARPWRPITN